MELERYSEELGEELYEAINNLLTIVTLSGFDPTYTAMKIAPECKTFVIQVDDDNFWWFNYTRRSGFMSLEYFDDNGSGSQDMYRMEGLSSSLEKCIELLEKWG